MVTLRDIALFLLALEGAAFTLGALALLAVVNYGLLRLRWWHRIACWLALARHYLHLGRRVVEQGCRVAVTPILVIWRIQAGAAAIARALMRAGQRG